MLERNLSHARNRGTRARNRRSRCSRDEEPFVQGSSETGPAAMSITLPTVRAAAERTARRETGTVIVMRSGDHQKRTAGKGRKRERGEASGALHK